MIFISLLNKLSFLSPKSLVSSELKIVGNSSSVSSVLRATCIIFYLLVFPGPFSVFFVFVVFFLFLYTLLVCRFLVEYTIENANPIQPRLRHKDNFRNKFWFVLHLIKVRYITKRCLTEDDINICANLGY